MKEPAHIIVVGASAGGLKAIAALLTAIQDVEDAAIFIVLHVAKSSSGSILTNLLQKKTKLNCNLAMDGQRIEPGSVYVARPDYHLIIKPGYIQLINGPRENRWRPSIDVLFRSAAVAYNSRVTGIILTGLLDDGTAGMVAIKRCGGTCIVQEPDEAEFQDMPSNVLQRVDVDYRVPITDIGYILNDMFSKSEKPSVKVPQDLLLEAGMTENMKSQINDLEKIGTHSNYTCPECGGGLWSIDNDPIKRYRCFTGHVFTQGLLLEQQSEHVEESLWASIRMMEEKRDLLLTTAHNYQLIGNEAMSNNKRTEADIIESHISQIKGLIQSLKENYNEKELN
ncbi:chemotaxis protein CheB [Mucilaginibacter panaciglaebae]|uniref:protein-glutamate methylesterase n=1 Tax=Mucilaginibacter panaciglaebae TaxID=502331 RepID=A0ABP7X4U1_9SPHI